MLTVHRVIGLLGVGVATKLSGDVAFCAVAGLVLGLSFGISRFRSELNANMLEANDEGLRVTWLNGGVEIVPWPNVLSIQAWKELNRFAHLRVHMLCNGVARVLAIWQDCYRNEAELFVRTCARRSVAVRTEPPSGALGGLVDDQLFRPIAKRAGLDALYAAATALILTRNVTATLIAVVAFPVSSAIIYALHLPIRQIRFTWNGKAWDTYRSGTVRQTTTTPRSIRWWLETQLESSHDDTVTCAIRE